MRKGPIVELGYNQYKLSHDIHRLDHTIDNSTTWTAAKKIVDS